MRVTQSVKDITAKESKEWSEGQGHRSFDWR